MLTSLDCDKFRALQITHVATRFEQFINDEVNDTGLRLTMTTIIGQDTVMVMSSRSENFAMMIESAEYAQMQANLFEVLWEVSEPHPLTDVSPSIE